MRSFVTLNSALLSWPRCNARLYWSATDLYTTLRMGFYGGVPSKWVYNCLAKWREWLRDIGMSPDSVLQSSNATEKPTGDDFGHPVAVLPFTSVCSVGLLALLARWAGCSTQKGGLRDESARSAARSLLEAVLSSSAHARPAGDLEIRFDAHWQARWSLSEVRPADLLLPIDSSGRMDVTEWQCKFACTTGGLVYSWWRTLLKTKCDMKGRLVKISDLLIATAGAVEGLFRQVAWQAGLIVEKAAYASLKLNLRGDDIIQVRTLDLMQIAQNPRRLDTVLLQHVVAGVHASTVPARIFARDGQSQRRRGPPLEHRLRHGEQSSHHGLPAGSSWRTDKKTTACARPPPEKKFCRPHAHLGPVVYTNTPLFTRCSYTPPGRGH